MDNKFSSNSIFKLFRFRVTQTLNLNLTPNTNNQQMNAAFSYICCPYIQQKPLPRSSVHYYTVHNQKSPSFTSLSRLKSLKWLYWTRLLSGFGILLLQQREEETPGGSFSSSTVSSSDLIKTNAGERTDLWFELNSPSCLKEEISRWREAVNFKNMLMEVQTGAYRRQTETQTSWDGK